MISIIHGDDIVSSRKYFLEQRQKTTNPFTFEGGKIIISDILQVLEGGGLFGDDKKIFIEDFFSKRKPGLEFNDIISYLQKNSQNGDVYFWEGKEIPKKNLSIFPDCKVLAFKLPQTLFLFLDNIKLGNGKNLIILFHKTLATTEVELIFHMLVRQFRLLLASSGKGVEQIDEVKRLAPWQKSKLVKQSSYFTVDKLKIIYKRLYKIDLLQKTGGLSLSLVQAIDFFLLDL